MRLIVLLGAVLGLAVGLTFAEEAPLAEQDPELVVDVDVDVDDEGRIDVARLFGDLFGESYRAFVSLDLGTASLWVSKGSWRRME